MVQDHASLTYINRQPKDFQYIYMTINVEGEKIVKSQVVAKKWL